MMLLSEITSKKDLSWRWFVENSKWEIQNLGNWVFPEANPSSKPHNHPMKWSFQAQVCARKYRKQYSLKDKSATGADLHINHGYQRKDVKCVTCLWLVDRLFPRRNHYQSMCCLQKQAMMSSKQQINSSIFAGSTQICVDDLSIFKSSTWPRHPRTVHGSTCSTPISCAGSKLLGKSPAAMAHVSVGYAVNVPIWWVVWKMIFFPYIGNNHPNWLSYFSEDWNHQPAMIVVPPNMFFGLALLRCSFVFPDLALGDSCVAGRLYAYLAPERETPGGPELGIAKMGIWQP